MVKIHIGCGNRWFGPDWIHIDGGDYKHLDSHDITNLSYMADGCADIVYASHVIEYFDREEIIPILSEWYRVLKPHGIIRLAVPNFEIITKLYHEGKFPLQNFLGPLFGKIKMKNNFVYHKTTYDYQDLKKVLNEIGFINIKIYDWKNTEHSHIDDHSQAYLPHMDKENGTLISLNVEAEKPSENQKILGMFL